MTAVIAPWLERASAEVEAVADLLNATNLFPVPDADTGTNMAVTLRAAARGAKEDGASGAAHAALMEASGNSGVILSEIIRGIASAIDHGWAAAWIAGDAAAQSAVSHAKPGTILSVTRAIAQVAQEHVGSTDRELASAIWRAARTAALDSADHPPIPQARGTVDAGAHGLERVVAAFAAVVGDGDCAALPVTPPTVCASVGDQRSTLYEVMYLLEGCSAESAERLRAELDGIGDSVLVVGDEQMWNVHVHLEDAGAAVEAGIAHGRPRRIRITPLNTEISDRTLIVVSNGPGLSAILAESGARVIDASGGRRLEPKEFVAAGEGAREVILMPHDRRSLAAAVESVERLRLSGIRVAVLPTKSTVQVLAALAVHDPTRSFDDDLVAMTAAAGHTRYATLATAQRDAVTSIGQYHAGDHLGLVNGEVAVIGRDLASVAFEVVTRMIAGGGELLTLVTGDGIPADLVEAVTAHVRERRPEIEIQVFDGGQMYYPLLVGLE